MTPKIIFKQRHRDRNTKRRYTPMRNVGYLRYMATRDGVLKMIDEKMSSEHHTEYVRYIGTREGVAMNKQAKSNEQNDTITTEDRLIYTDEDDELFEDEIELAGGGGNKYNSADNRQKLQDMSDEENGLFGYVNREYSETVNLSEAEKYIRKMTTSYRDIFHCVYSFTSSSADEAGLHRLMDWQNWVKYHMNEIAKRMNMKIENLEWYAAVHLKEGQPHVHIMYWDVTQKIAINKVDPKICDAIRIDAIKSTYKGFFNDLHNQEDELIKDLRGMISAKTDDMLIVGPTDEYQKHIAGMLNHIYNDLPKKGQLRYAYMPSETKEALNALTDYIINNDSKLKGLYDGILDKRRIYNEALHSSDSNWGRYKLSTYMGKLDDDIKSGVGNTVLKILAREKRAHHERLFDMLDIPDPLFEEDVEDPPQQDTATPKSLGHIRWTKSFMEAKSYVQNNNDIEKALRLYRKEAVKGNVLAIYEIADLYRRKLIEPDNEHNAEIYFKAALEGFIEVQKTNDRMRPYLQYRIGRMYYDGYGIEQDYVAALAWLEKAAQAGNHLSEYTVAKMYHNGIGTAPDFRKAEYYYGKAADSGNIYALCALGKMYLREDIPNKINEGIELLNTAILTAKKGQAAYAQCVLGTEYYYNTKILDKEKGLELLETSVRNGSISGKCTLGKIYIQGEVPDKIEEGVKILELAIAEAKGEFKASAQYTLGTAYYYNDAIRNEQRAIELLAEAANQGNVYAKCTLGKIYLQTEDPVKINDGITYLNDTIESAAGEFKYYAHYTLGMEYYRNEHIRNLDKAVELLMKSADGGYAAAKCMLGRLYLNDIPGKTYEGIQLLTETIETAPKEHKAFAQYILGAAYYYNDDIRDVDKALELLTQSADGGNEYAASLIERINDNQQVNVANLMNSVVMLLQNADSSTDRALHDMSVKVFGRGDLSKEAIAELIYKLQDKQNTAEM